MWRRSEPHLRGSVAPGPIDVNIVPDEPAHRRKKLLGRRHGVRPSSSRNAWTSWPSTPACDSEIAAITERAMRGELDFEAAIKERVGLLRAATLCVLDDLYAQRVTLMPGAQTLIATMRKNGAYCAPRLRRVRLFHAEGRAAPGLRHRAGKPPRHRRRQDRRHGGRCRSWAARPSSRRSSG